MQFIRACEMHVKPKKHDAPYRFIKYFKVVFGWRARWNRAAPSQFFRMEWLHSVFGIENRTTLFFVWLESQNRMEPLRPLFDWRVKRIWLPPHLVVRLPYSKNISL
jgi:hypothetical protein